MAKYLRPYRYNAKDFPAMHKSKPNLNLYYKKLIDDYRSRGQEMTEYYKNQQAKKEYDDKSEKQQAEKERDDLVAQVNAQVDAERDAIESNKRKNAKYMPRGMAARMDYIAGKNHIDSQINAALANKRGQEMTEYYKRPQDVATQNNSGLQYGIIQDGEQYSGSLQDVSVDDLKMRDGRVKYYQMLQNALRNNNKEEVNRLAAIGNQYLKMAYGNKPNLTADNIPVNGVNRNNPEAFNNAYNDLMCAAYNDSVHGGNTRLLFTKDGDISLQKRTMSAPSAVIDVYNSFTQKPQLTAEEEHQLILHDRKNNEKQFMKELNKHSPGEKIDMLRDMDNYDQSIADKALEKKNHQTLADVNAKEQTQNDSAYNSFKNNGQYNMPDDPDELATQEVNAFNVAMRLSNNYDRLRSNTGTQNMDDTEADKLIAQKYPSTKQAIDQFNFASNKYYSDSEAYSKYAESKGTNFNTYYMYKFNELMANSSQTPQSDKQIYAKAAAKLKTKCEALGIIDKETGKYKANPETPSDGGANKLMDDKVIGGGK